METVHVTLLGHKDHGKSTLLGRLLFDTGQAKADKLETLKEMSRDAGKPFEFAHLLDSFMEERQNEMTIDTTRATIKGERYLYEIIDVPGHKELIANMLSGASHASSAFLLVSAKEGVEAQTKDHLRLASFLGIKTLFVLINKMDAAGYEEGRFRLLEKNLRDALHDTGFTPHDIAMIPISAREGDNLVSKSERIPWYQGQTVMEALNSLEPARPPAHPTVFLIQDIHHAENDHIISGYLESGAINVGDTLTAMPHNISCAVQKIMHGVSEIPRAIGGESIGLVLKGNPPVARGDILTDKEGITMLRAAKEIALMLFALKPLAGNNLTAECGGREANIKTLEPVPALHEFANTALALDAPLITSMREDSLLNKVVLKHRGEIVAIGKVS